MAADRQQQGGTKAKHRGQDLLGANPQMVDPAALGATMAGTFVPVTTVNRTGIAEDLDAENFREME